MLTFGLLSFGGGYLLMFEKDSGLSSSTNIGGTDTGNTILLDTMNPIPLVNNEGDTWLCKKCKQENPVISLY